MRIVRCLIDGRARFGVLKEDTVYILKRSPFISLAHSNRLPDAEESAYRLDKVKLLAPCVPSKVVCQGLNYRSHIPELGFTEPAWPLIFIKPSTALIGPGEAIILPRFSTRVDYEGELGIVIGRKARDVAESRAGDYILGYTCFNDVTERDQQKADVQWTRAKSYDTFAPLGPWIETELDPADLKVETYLNGERRQSGRTSQLIFGISRLVSFISGVMTLLPGDVIATGTPSGVGPMAPGDVVEVTIDGVGTLRNTVSKA